MADSDYMAEHMAKGLREHGFTGDAGKLSRGFLAVWEGNRDLPRGVLGLMKEFGRVLKEAGGVTDFNGALCTQTILYFLECVIQVLAIEGPNLPAKEAKFLASHLASMAVNMDEVASGRAKTISVFSEVLQASGNAASALQRAAGLAPSLPDSLDKAEAARAPKDGETAKLGVN